LHRECIERVMNSPQRHRDHRGQQTTCFLISQ
jgi:hypothetical protein